jgi:hypothetical protein
VVLTGKVVQRGDNLRIQAELVHAADGSQIWGQRYNRKVADVFDIEEEIAREISDALRLRLSGAEQKQLVKRYTGDNEAYQLYLKGRYYWNLYLWLAGPRSGLLKSTNRLPSRMRVSEWFMRNTISIGRPANRRCDGRLHWLLTPLQFTTGSPCNCFRAGGWPRPSNTQRARSKSSRYL